MVKKAVSIVFQVRFDDKNPGASNGHFSLYRQLRRKRQLAKFCRDAFLEKATRHLNGQYTSYQQLNDLIKSKGVGYILESIQQEEVQVAQAAQAASTSAIADTAAAAAVNHETAIVNPPAQAVAVTAEPAPELVATNDSEFPKDASIKRVDLEKLKGLL